MTKSCIVCGKTLTGKQTKLCSDRECHRKDAKEYRQNNREAMKRQNREWRQNNQEHLEAYRQKNKERIKKRDHEYYLNNREKINKRNREYSRKRYLNNPERMKEAIRKYRQNNTEKIKDDKRKRYRLGRGIPEDWDLSRESSIEVILRRWLQESDIEFVQHHFINLENATKTHVDFYIPEVNICLYCDGDYWHGPERPDIQERDARINKALEEMGYSVIRLSESDILAGVRPIEILDSLCTIHAA